MVGDIERVLAALNAAKVRYLVVGGVAVVLHGYLRTTGDLDLVVQLVPDNAHRAIGALTSLGFRPRIPVLAMAFADRTERESWMREKGLTVFSRSPQVPGMSVDLFVEEPFEFDAVHARAVRVPLAWTEAAVLSLEDLIAMKRRVGRPRDVEDIAALEAIAERKRRDG